MPTKEEAIIKIKSLVQRFDEQKEFYKKTDYNETQTRRDFIDPFWKALGWDVDNENGYAESYREVIHEDRIKIGKETKFPDYAFRLLGLKDLFFLEGKKPSVNIKDDLHSAYQIRRYGWSAKMAISILSNFEEFAVYDCSNKPKPTDRASNARITYLTYHDYIAQFDFIWDTFSREKVLKGSFDKFIQSDTNKKGTTTVDNEFLASLDKWRMELARIIALRNRNITEDELNFAVQLILDRVIFLRIAEDRNVERYGDLKDAVKQGNYYQNILQLFQLAEQKYNSGLFDFAKDKICDKIVIDDKIIKNIIRELYYPECPYEFSVLSVEILGSAYERFLGKQIILSRGGRATVVEKPEVRKAGGVYYTPQYIVDYIVKNTVGKLLLQLPADSTKEDDIERKSEESYRKSEESALFRTKITPDDVSKIKIVDPACGSGSFLIGAYKYLLDWHKDYYTNINRHCGLDTQPPRPGTQDSPLTPLGELTTAEKKRILLNNIYGVDIDVNAVEVTKLSLLLKCMEGETKETIAAQRKLFKDRVLPSLDNNIKSGNSLIDLDYYDNQLDFGEERKIKPFSWQMAFPEVFSAENGGGFDCVIGNPPYVNIRNLTLSLPKNAKNYLSQKFKTAFKGYDLYVLFIEKAINILNENGIFGYITPNKFATLDYGYKTRELLLKRHSIVEICDVSKLNVFSEASVYPYLTVTKKKSIPNNIIQIVKCDTIDDLKNKQRSELKQLDLLKSNYNISLNLKSKIEPKNYVYLKNICKVQAGTTGFLATKTKKCIVEGGDAGLDFIVTGNIDRYNIKFGNVRYINKKFKKPKLINNQKIITTGKWDLYSKPKIVIGGMTKVIEAAYDDVGIAVGVGVYCLTEFKNNPYLILGILNSKFTAYYFINEFEAKHLAGGYLAINVGQLELIPFPTNVSKKHENKIINLVDQLLQLNKDLLTITLPNHIEQIESKIKYFEKQIDKIVYELYGLTEEEIKVVEGK
ncbi:MAG: Eco57I restriction-modification methylase domain-containing protein [Marinilabiliaceae bacterium]|nr:Eco57I restriction-modification methylase domain-containing protein [Marinilabiliaceae bacterium]